VWNNLTLASEGNFMSHHGNAKRAQFSRSDFRFIHRLRVRWAEVDLQGVVFNAHYLTYLDTAMADYWRALALPYVSAMKRLSGDLFVKKATLEYHASARYDDLLDIGMHCVRVGNSSILFEGAVFAGEKLLVNGELVYVFADPEHQTSRPVPPELRSVMESFEKGGPVSELRIGDWKALGTLVSELREEVFVNEQGIGTQLVWDDADATAVHAMLRNHLGQPVATGRLLQHAPKVGRIGRMAVSRVLRGSHLGREVLDALVNTSRDRGDREVILHAQCSAEKFYLRQGFLPRGKVFEEAGIAHIEMVLPM
jgi:YbgC/YbaW family acyl-CoA thioester hydrolase